MGGSTVIYGKRMDDKIIMVIIAICLLFYSLCYLVLLIIPSIFLKI